MMAALFLTTPVLLRSASFGPASAAIRSTEGEAVHGRRTRALDWAEWARTQVTVDGNATDWMENYTAHDIGRPGLDVDLYMANNDTYLYICIDARSDTTDEHSVNDEIRLLIDGDNDNWICQPIGSTTNESTTDNWITICGNTSARSNQSGIRNDAGWLNTGGGAYGDPGVYVSQWFDAQNPYLQNRFPDYQYAVGFNGTPGNMVYEIGIPMYRWNWTPGDDLGACLLVFRHGDGQPIGIWPMGFDRNNLASWKDFYLATPNDRPSYSEPLATPLSVCNDNENTSLLTVEAEDPDGNITSVIIDLSSIGGASQTVMVDNGTCGDMEAGDATFSYEARVPSMIAPGTYNLSFVIADNHTPNVGMAKGKIVLRVLQHNRRPIIQSPELDRNNLAEDGPPAFFNLTPVFTDPDPEDILSYYIRNGTGWDARNSTSMAAYSILSNDTVQVRPRPNMYGAEVIEVRARDSQGLWTDSAHLITVLVKRTNDPPEIINLNDSSIQAENLTLRAYEDVWNTYRFMAEDIDGDVLDYELNLSESLSDLRWGFEKVFHEENGTLLIKPLNQHVGSHRLGISVDDGEGGSEYLPFDLDVINTNDPPVLDNIADVNIEQDEWVHILPTARDDDLIWGDRLTFSTNLTSEVSSVITDEDFLFNASTGEFLFRPDWSMVGRYHIYIAVRDSRLREHRRDFVINVMDVNDPPWEPFFNYTVDPITRCVRFRAMPPFDPDGDPMTLQWDFGDESPGQTGGTDVNHTYPDYGNYTVILWVTDGNIDGINSSSRVVELKKPDPGTGEPWEPNDANLTISGSVRDATGAGISGAHVKLMDPMNPTDPRPAFSNDTDETGRFSFVLPPGEYKLTITAEGYADYGLDVSLLARDRELDIVLVEESKGAGDASKKGDSASTKDWLIPVLIASVVFLLLVIILLLVMRKRRAARREGIETGSEQLSDPSATQQPPVQSTAQTYTAASPPEAERAATSTVSAGTVPRETHYQGAGSGGGYSIAGSDVAPYTGGALPDLADIDEGTGPRGEADREREIIDFGVGSDGSGKSAAGSVSGEGKKPKETGAITDDLTKGKPAAAMTGLSPEESEVPSPSDTVGEVQVDVDAASAAVDAPREGMDGADSAAGGSSSSSAQNALHVPPPDKEGLQNILKRIVDRDNMLLQPAAAVATVAATLPGVATPPVAAMTEPPNVTHGETAEPDKGGGAPPGRTAPIQQEFPVAPADAGGTNAEPSSRTALDELFPEEPSEGAEAVDRVSLNYLFKDVREPDIDDATGPETPEPGAVEVTVAAPLPDERRTAEASARVSVGSSGSRTLDDLMSSLFEGDPPPIDPGAANAPTIPENAPSDPSGQDAAPGNAGIPSAPEAAAGAGTPGNAGASPSTASGSVDEGKKEELRSLLTGLIDKSGQPTGDGDNGGEPSQ